MQTPQIQGELVDALELGKRINIVKAIFHVKLVFSFFDTTLSDGYYSPIDISRLEQQDEMKFIELNPYKVSYKAIKEVADTIAGGGVAIYPTDTTYGMGCDVFNKKAITRIGEIKGREKGEKPFSFICKDIAQISKFAFLSNPDYRLMSRLLPGPYTFILEARRANLPKKMLGKRNTVGVRIPDHPVCATLLDILEEPIVTTSVNLSGEDPVLDPSTLPSDFTQKIDIIVSTGPLGENPSTIVDLTGDDPQVLRQGLGKIDW